MQKRNILVVEDQKLNQVILKEILQDEYRVIYANNGQEAMEILREQLGQLSAVLLDIVMPVMDGYDVLRTMQKENMLGQIPVLVASQRFGDDSELKALNLGANDFVPKPYNPPILLQRIKNLIELYESMRKVVVLERDDVTGLFNKAAFLSRSAEVLEEHPEKKYDMIVLDIEHFKLINESCGFEEGDKLLKYIGGKLSELLDEEYTVCAREYADRFFVFRERNRSKFEDFHRVLVESIENYPLDMKVHLKFGIYQIQCASMDIQIMCDRAVCAVKRGKGTYGADILYYDDSIGKQMYLEQQITDDMVRALKAGEFQVYLQPKYDLFSEKMAGAEALVRWIHPEKGIIPPNEFIPVFEKNGFITELDMYIWEKTCEIISNWMKEENKYVPVSVNVSRKDIYKENLPEVFLGLLNKYGLKQKYLHLEITESAYTENPDQLIKAVNDLKNAGFTIEMDDFGSGYSSLNMLSELPIDILKLDMKIIQSYGERNSSRSIINFIMGLAKWMNLHVVAEGVETKEQIDLLKSLDCGYAQGYYFAKPMPDKDFENELKKLEVSHMAGAEDELENARILVRDYDKDQIMLVIDDLAMNRAIITDYFRDTFSIVEASNGEAALSYFKRGGKADIIILDIYMPHMDGFQVLEELKKETATKDIPVIVSSQADDTTIIKALRAGAADFMTKPFAREDALRCVNHVLSDLSKKIRREEKEIRDRMDIMEKLATTDFLTGLWNRPHFEKLVRNYLAKNENVKCNFIMVDIDDFKDISDRFGHLVGDEILQKIATRLMYCFRENDIVCRMGGDEFAILMKAEMNREELMERMQELHRSMDFEISGQHITCSSGVCCYPEHGTDFMTLYRNADKALFRAKRNGKNQNVFFEKFSDLHKKGQ